MTDVIDWYYHSETFRRETPIHLPENEKREYQVIDRSLQNQRTCDIIADWLDQTAPDMTADEFRGYLRSHFLRDNQDCYIYTDSFLLRQWDQLKVPADIVPKKTERKNSMDQSRRVLHMIALRGDESIDRENMEACIGQLRRSLADKDMNTFDYGLKAMAYLLDTCYETSESRNNVWNFYKKIFELSEEIQRLKMGEVLVMHDRLYPYVGYFPDISEYGFEDYAPIEEKQIKAKKVDIVNLNILERAIDTGQMPVPFSGDIPAVDRLKIRKRASRKAESEDAQIIAEFQRNMDRQWEEFFGGGEG